MAEAKVVSTKIKKKNWYPIIAPKIFRGAVLGETTVYDQNAMVGKTITQNLMSLTGDVKRQNISIDFIVTKVEDGKALTEVIGYHMMPASARRMTRRSSEKIDLSFVCATSDGKHVRIKPLMFAISNTKGSVTANIIKTAVDFLVKTVNQMSYDNLINDLVNHKLQSSLRDALKKIYPLRICEIRAMYIDKGKKHVEERAAVKEEPNEIAGEVAEEIKETIAEEANEEKAAAEEKAPKAKAKKAKKEAQEE
ncbi:hypothetical protein J4458_06400 [Candidatus Woesearchaeota archaeon]|nr:hypothetical protein [Candidatus Woesearchaeota archaeon]